MLVLQPVTLPVGGARLAAELAGPPAAAGVVVIARGTGSCRHDPRHRAVAGRLHRAGLAAVLVDLLTDAEERSALGCGAAADTALLAERFVAVVDWTARQPLAGGRAIGLLGSAAASAAAITAAGERPGTVHAVAVVPAGHHLPGPSVPQTRVLAVLGEQDERPESSGGGALEVLEPRAGRGGHEPALDDVAEALAEWFSRVLRA